MNLKLKLGPDQLSELMKAYQVLLDRGTILANISELDYFNMRSLIKRMFDKLYSNSLKATHRKKDITMNVDLNEHQSMINVYMFNKEFVPEVVGSYFEMLFGEVFSQLDQQKISLSILIPAAHEPRTALPH